MSNQKQKTGKKPDPCPFCGGECLTSNAIGGMWRVYCEKDMTCLYSSGTFVTEAEAIAAHNRVCRAVESAAKQSVTDCNHLGNAAKMREALETISKCDISKEEDCYTLYRVCEAALSAPPRNCDIGTALEQVYRHGRRCAIVDHCEVNCRVCFAKWVQMPYEKGGVK